MSDGCKVKTERFGNTCIICRGAILSFKVTVNQLPGNWESGSVSVCDVNNDRILHWLGFYMRSASLHNKPNGLQIQAPIIYLMDH